MYAKESVIYSYPVERCRLTLSHPFPLISVCMQNHKSAVPSMLISVEGTGKNQLELGRESIGGSSF